MSHYKPLIQHLLPAKCANSFTFSSHILYSFLLVVTLPQYHFSTPKFGFFPSSLHYSLPLLFYDHLYMSSLLCLTSVYFSSSLSVPYSFLPPLPTTHSSSLPPSHPLLPSLSLLVIVILYFTSSLLLWCISLLFLCLRISCSKVIYMEVV